MGWKNDELKEDRSSRLPEMDSYCVVAQTPHIRDYHPHTPTIGLMTIMSYFMRKKWELIEHSTYIPSAFTVEVSTVAKRVTVRSNLLLFWEGTHFLGLFWLWLIVWNVKVIVQKASHHAASDK